MGTIYENHTLHIIRNNTHEEIAGVLIQVDENESVFHEKPSESCEHDYTHFDHKDSVCSLCGEVDKGSNEHD